MLNGDTIAIIEIKYKLDRRDVQELVTGKLRNFRQYFPNYKNHKIILGAGGMGFDDDAIKEAKKKGIVIIKVVGDKVEFHTEGIKEY